MTIQDRIASAETLTSAALVPWIARSMALRERMGFDLVGTAEALAAPAGIVDGIKAAVAAATTTGLPEIGGNSAAMTAFAAQAARTSAFFGMFAGGGFQRIPFETNLLTIGSDISAALVGEGAPIPMSPLDFNATNLRSRKAGSLVAMTDSVWRDMTRAGQSVVNEAIRRTIGRIVDGQMFNMLLASGAPEQTISDLDALGAFVGEALDYLRTTADARPWFAVSPQADNFLIRLAISHPNLNITQDSFMGFPKVLTDGLQQRQMAVIDAAGVAANIESMQIRTSREATLEMLDNPTNSAATGTATTQVSLFQANATAVRFLLDYGLEPARSNVMALATVAEAGS